MFDGLLQKHYDVVFPFREATFSFLKKRLPAGASTVLDIGCGTGSMTAAFARLGRKTTGIDLGHGMISKASATHPGPAYKQLDMLKIKELKTRFGYIYSTGNVVSFCKPSDRRNFLKAVFDSLATGGTWVYQTVNWDRIMLEQSHTFPDIPMAKTGMVFKRRYSDITPTTVRFTTSFEKDGMVTAADTVTLYPVRSDGYIQEHRNAGFSLTAHYGGFDGVPFSAQNSGASILVFKR